MNPVNDIAMWLQLAMLIANIGILIANLVKAAQKPTQVQNQRRTSILLLVGLKARKATKALEERKAQMESRQK